MTDPRLPDGFAVQVDRRVRVLGEGSALLGGSPTRLLRLAPAARTMLAGGRLEVHDTSSAQVARALLDATVAHPRPPSGPSHLDVTVVVPVRDNLPGVCRLLAALKNVKVVVVDDGSVRPIAADDLGRPPCEVQVLRHDTARGAAAARNTGLAAAATDFVAFLDSDVVPRRGWLEALLGHFCDPAVALVAPRIVGLAPPVNLISRYEAVRSSLDLGLREAPVQPYGAVSYVPSAAIICRRSALAAIGGFDESMTCGEDVDMCWRLVECGARLRYEPVALVAHDHRTRTWEWLVRKAFYGTSAAPLAARHPGKTAPLVLSRWTLAVVLLTAMSSAVGRLLSLAVALCAGQRVARALRDVDPPASAVLSVACRGLWSAVLALAAALCRHYWPAALVAAMFSRRLRTVLLVAAVLDGVADWLKRSGHHNEDDQKRVGLLTYLLLKRLDDLAYGAGLWTGVVREANIRPLLPQIRT